MSTTANLLAADPGWLVYLAGSAWDGVAGTDRQLVDELATHRPVLWVDPPESVRAWLPTTNTQPVPLGLTEVADRVWRLRLLAPPGQTRPVMRDVTAAVTRAGVAAGCRRLKISGTGPGVYATVVANPEARFPSLPGLKVLYATDDWPAGAELMGLSADRIEAGLRVNTSAADLVCGVTPALTTTTAERAEHRSVAPATLVLPNGCRTIDFPTTLTRPEEAPEGPYALIVGQLNERTDPSLLLALADAGVDVMLVGPRTDRDIDFGRRLTEALDHPRLRWVGRRPQDELAGYLRHAAVGLTPYAASEFNAASFPLKSLEYLAAGLPVVSTRLPANDWLATDLIEVAADENQFVSAVRAAISADATPAMSADSALVRRRRSFAAGHHWRVRAATLEAELNRLANSSARPTGVRLANSRLGATS